MPGHHPEMGHYENGSRMDSRGPPTRAPPLDDRPVYRDDPYYVS